MKQLLSLKNLLLATLTLLPISLLIYSTKNNPQPIQKNQQLHLLATTSIIADILKNIVQGAKNKDNTHAVTIHTLIKIGMDPHTYEPTLQDAIHCNKAHIIFTSGLNLEGTMGNIFANLGQIKPVYIATDILKKMNKKIIKDPNYPGGADPHFWGNPSYVALVTDYFVQILQKKQPQHTHLYAKNGEKFKKKINDLLLYMHAKTKQIPKEKRIFITTHDSFSYLLLPFNFQIKSLKGATTAREITLNRREQLAKMIVEKNIKVIFLEIGGNEKGVKSLVESCKLAGHHVKICDQPLYGDSLGRSGTSAGTYIGMTKHNFDIITQALL